MKWRVDNRITLAAFVAPLSILVFIPAASLLSSKGQVSVALIYSGVRLALVLLPYAYVLMLLLGIPLFLILRRYGLATIWTAGATGFATVLIFPAAIALLSAATDHHPAVTYWAYAMGLFKVALFLLLRLRVPIVGAAVGVIFWAVAGSQPPSNVPVLIERAPPQP
jgi:hypothetical protein